MISERFITCALTGVGNTDEHSPHVLVTPEQIAQSAIEATRSGAAVVHIYVRDPKNMAGLARSGIVSDGARERLAHVEELRPKICTLDCGSRPEAGATGLSLFPGNRGL